MFVWNNVGSLVTLTVLTLFSWKYFIMHSFLNLSIFVKSATRWQYIIRLWSLCCLTNPGARTGRLTSPQLMEMPSLARSPVAPVLFSRSEPAKSTKWNLAVSVSYSSISELPLVTRLSVSFSCCVKIMHVNTLSYSSMYTQIFLPPTIIDNKKEKKKGKKWYYW